MAIFFGRYQLLRKLAAGGMGQVLLARKGAEGFEKLVVIKRILPHLVEDEEFFQMFLDEAKIAMRLDHPNIARISEFGEEQGIHYLEMEYISGEDVRRIDKKARAAGTVLPLGCIIRIIADAAAGLDFAHKARDAKGQPLNLVHRDVSPQNVLVGFDGSVKLIDFGVAKAAGRVQHTATGILKGKFPYMSPEQADGFELDARSDVFALGVVLWELLTGKRLFRGDDDLMTQRLVRTCVVAIPSSVNAGLPTELDAVVLKALAKDRDDRFPDAASFRQALEDFALQRAISTSSADLAAFLRPLYAERIRLESDPRSLEDESGLTGLDGASLEPRPIPSRVSAAGQPQNPKTTTYQRRSGGLAPPPPPEAELEVEIEPVSAPVPVPVAPAPNRLLAGAVGVALLALTGVAVAVWLKPKPVEPTPVVAPLPVALVVDAGALAVVVPIPPPPPLPLPPPPPPPPPLPQLIVSLNSEPSGAQVELAGERKGVTPLELRVDSVRLPAVLKLSRDGYESLTSQLTAETPATLSLPLRKRVVKPVGPKPPDIKTSR